MYGIGPKVPPPRPATPHLDLIERAREESPYPVTVQISERSYRKFLSTLDRSTAVLDVSYRRGTLTIRHIGEQRKDRT